MSEPTIGITESAKAHDRFQLASCASTLNGKRYALGHHIATGMADQTFPTACRKLAEYSELAFPRSNSCEHTEDLAHSNPTWTCERRPVYSTPGRGGDGRSNLKPSYQVHTLQYSLWVQSLLPPICRALPRYSDRNTSERANGLRSIAQSDSPFRQYQTSIFQ